MSSAVLFWVLVEALGLLALPTAATWLGRLPGRGLVLARPLALLLVAYPAWILASLHLLPYSSGTILLGIGLLAALSLGLLLRRQPDGGTLWRGVRGDRLALNLWLAGEVLFAVCFFGWAVMRAYAPDVWGTEKPMDMAFINAINRSAWFPPNDPWLSGATINYYYFGHFIIAYLIRLTGVAPTVGFNLGVCLTYALCVCGVFAVASALFAAARRPEERTISPILPGLAGAALAMLLGNLDGALELVQKPGDLAGFDWWSPSRVIANTINEFPFFSFLLADLHAHMLVVPFGLLVLAFSVQLAMRGPRLPWATERPPVGAGSPAREPLPVQDSQAAPVEPAPEAPRAPRRLAPSETGVLAAWLPAAAELALAALAAGALYAFNGWDYPTELGIGFLALLLWASRADAGKLPVGRLLGWAGAWAVLSFVLFLPFYLHFSAPTGGIGLVQQTTPFMQFLHDYLLIYGLFVWIIGAAFISQVRRSGVARRHLAWGVIGGLTVLTALASVHLGGLAVLLAIAAFALGVALEGKLAQGERLWWLLIGVAVGLATIGEVVYIRDAFDHTADYRMNTIFKFGYQAWFLLSVAGGCAVFWSRRWLRADTRPFWYGVMGLLVLAAGVYPVAGTYAREAAFRSPPSLDGMRWLAEQAPGDAAAIHWLQANVRGAPTILEAVGVQYDPNGHARVSTYTGMPTVVGWPGHEGEWAHDVGSRPDDVKTIYSTTDLALARSLLQRYNVRYVFVGSLEQKDYPAAGLAKFAQLGAPVFSQDGTVIYAVR